MALNARDERVELYQFSPSDAIVPVNSEPGLMNQPTFIETINNTRAPCYARRVSGNKFRKREPLSSGTCSMTPLETSFERNDVTDVRAGVNLRDLASEFLFSFKRRIDSRCSSRNGFVLSI